MASLNSSISRLDSAFRVLSERWADTAAVWKDQVRWDFESEFWTPLKSQVSLTCGELEKLGKVIDGARRNVK